MNHINRTLLAATLGSTLLALEACRKADTNRLAGRWKYVGGDFFLRPNESIIFDFAKDGIFMEERVSRTSYYGYYGYSYSYNSTTENGDWKWASGKKIEVDREFTYDIVFEVIMIKGDDMELEDEVKREWNFKKE